MIEEKNIIYLRKVDIIEINNAAIRENRHRQLNESFLKKLSDYMLYPIIFFMLHSEDEVRIEISFDNNGKSGYVDMSILRYKSLPKPIFYEDGTIGVSDAGCQELDRPYPNRREWQEKINLKPVRRQNKFRKEVLKAYQNQCAVCDIKNTSLLRAAHITPVIEDNDDTINNGICLCVLHEVAFDRGILKIKPNGELIIACNEEIKIDSECLRFPDNLEDYPSEERLKLRFDKYL